MKFESIGLIIELKSFGARDFVARVFTKDFGVICGLFKAGQVLKAKPMLGQFGHVSWNARLDSQLGSFHFENEKNLTLSFFNSPEKLKYVNCSFSLLSKMLPEREKYEKLFVETLHFLENSISDIEERYLNWEQTLLAELGYGLMLGACGNCGKKNDLIFISPKTRRAICRICGEEYKDKLFKFPINLNITKRFLEEIAELPEIRLKAI